MANAQIIWGAKVGLNESQIIEKSNSASASYGNRTGFQLGMVADVQTSYFTFEPGISYSQRGAKDDNQNYLYNCIDIPLNFRYNMAKAGPVNVYLNAGPSLDFVLNAGYKMNNASYHTIGIGESYGTLNRTDIEMEIGAGVFVYRYLIGINYSVSMFNTTNTETSNVYLNKVVSVTATVLFGNPK
jgi:hypothetical protein